MPGSRQRSRGRPRDPRVDAAILRATLDLLAESGYARLSIEAVARRAGVGRPTVYLRWPSKAQLVHEAVFPAFPAGEPPVPDSGDFAADLRNLVTGALAYLSRPEVLAAAPGLLTEYADDPELHRLLAARLSGSVRDRFRERIAAAVERGEARPGTDADTLLDAITGTVLFGLLLRPDGRRGTALADLLLYGVSPPSAHPPADP